MTTPTTATATSSSAPAPVGPAGAERSEDQPLPRLPVSRARAVAGVLLWLAVIAPALAQLGLLFYAVLSRVGYPYDLEWMEGGLLGHAQRLAEHRGIYVEPSLDFIPYLYTPLYPALIALMGGLFDIGYLLGRIISLAALLATLAFVVHAIVRERAAHRSAAWAGAALACGLVAATYPWVDAWYDLVRADTLFLAMITGGLLAIRVWARVPGLAGRRRIGAAAALLALSFFCKQSGIFYVAAGGAALLVITWRRLPIYIAVAGAVGLGGTWLFNRATKGWFWTYIFQVHQAHDFDRHRFIESFSLILGHFPIMTGAIAAGLVAVGLAARSAGRRPPGCDALLYWSPIFALSVLVGAIGWGTEFAVFNAFIPAMATGALAAGAAVPALAGAASTLRRHPAGGAAAAYLLSGGALAAQLVLAWWQPGRFIPSERDRRAGDALIAHLHAVKGDVLVPSHPWYPVLAGKALHTHRMGLLDMTRGKRMTSEQGAKWQPRRVREAFRAWRFAEVILDDRQAENELAGLGESYRLDDYLPDGEVPRVYSGARTVPRSVWIPARPAEVPEGARMLFDFESGRLDGWKSTGRAWGKHPDSGSVARQAPVRRFGGRFYASSSHGGDESVGTLTSPTFTFRGSTITFLRSGGKNPTTLRIELWVEGRREKIETGNQSERMDDVIWNVASYAGQSGQIVLVDEETGSPLGHLNVDEFLIRD